jgi:hypothetical protein
VRRDIRADGIAELALVTEFHYVLNLVVIDPIGFAKVFIHQLEQVHKRRAEGMAKRAPVADIEYPQNLLPCVLRIPELL